MDTGKVYNWVIAGAWVVVVGAGLWWLYNRSQSPAAGLPPAQPTAASPPPSSTTANV